MFGLLRCVLVFSVVALALRAQVAGPQLVVLAKSEASAAFVDPLAGEERSRLPVGVGPHEAATSSDGFTVVVCNYGAREPGSSLTVLDAKMGEVLRTIELRRKVGEGDEAETERFFRPHGVQFLADGDRVVVTTETQRRLLVVDIRKGVIEAAIPTNAALSHMVALSADGVRAYIANIGGGSISAIDLKEQKPLAVIETGAGAEGIAVHPTTGAVWVGNRAANTISIVDPKELTEVVELECGSFPIRVAFTPDGAHALVSCATAGTVEVWSVADRERRHAISMADPESGEEKAPVPVGILVQPDGAFAYVANTQVDFVSVLDLRTWKLARRIPVHGEPDGMCWVPSPR